MLSDFYANPGIKDDKAVHYHKQQKILGKRVERAEVELEFPSDDESSTDNSLVMVPKKSRKISVADHLSSCCMFGCKTNKHAVDT